MGVGHAIFVMAILQQVNSSHNETHIYRQLILNTYPTHLTNVWMEEHNQFQPLIRNKTNKRQHPLT